jgi:hypothetical protein
MNRLTPAQYAALINERKPASRSKYGNRSVVVDGIKFDSKKEAAVHRDLQILVLAGEIVKVDLQVSFPIVINGTNVCSYRADFVAYGKDGNRRVIDAKGFKTPIYRLKKKLMKATYNIDIEEV